MPTSVRETVTEVRMTVPLVPPGVNHYVKHARNGRHYVTAEAKGFKNAMWNFRPVETLDKYDALEVEVIIYRGAKQKGDVDNYAKVVLDGLKECGVFESDDAVTDLTLRKRRDRANPRTEIVVRAL